MPHAARKQRTRQHVIADLAVHHMEGFFLNEGHTAQRVQSGYGYDLFMTTFDEHGWIEPGLVLIQCKATERSGRRDGSHSFDIDIRDYNLWTTEKRPVILILYEASGDRAFWTAIQEYFRDPARRPKKGAKSVRMHMPVQNVLNGAAIREMRELNRISQFPKLHRSDT